MQAQDRARIATGPRQGRFGRLAGGYDPNPLAIFGSCSVVFCSILVLFVAALKPNEYGLARNFLTGTVDEDVRRGGLHILGPVKNFVRFPATQVTLEFSSRVSSPVKTRTGADPEDPDSGGQPVAISCAVQYVLEPSELRSVYLGWGSYAAAHQRFILLSRNAVSNTAQEFTPQDFWQRRKVVAQRMTEQLRSTLRDAGTRVVRFQLTRVEFAESFEASVTAVQVAEQQRVVNEYDQAVQAVVQAIEVMKAENEALIANISAGAQADGRELKAGATRDAFSLKQGTKAREYARLKSTVGFCHEEMEEYFKIKSLQSMSAEGSVVVALDGLEDEPL